VKPLVDLARRAWWRWLLAMAAAALWYLVGPDLHLLPDAGAVERGELLAPFAARSGAWALVAAGVVLIAVVAALLLRRLRSAPSLEQ
jgi:hypothetical protein